MPKLGYEQRGIYFSFTYLQVDWGLHDLGWIQVGLHSSVGHVHVCSMCLASSLDHWISETCFSHAERQECKCESISKASVHKTSSNI